MRLLSYYYHMHLQFEQTVTEHHFKLRCFPANDERQKIFNEDIRIRPVHFSSSVTDSFGNMCIYGTSRQEHRRFSVDVRGKAEIDARSPVKADENQIALFRYETELTRAGMNIRKFHEGLEHSCGSGFDRAVYMMNELYESFSYVQGITGISTSAEEAFTLKKGVCQDYAHILLSLCRLERIPCRYIAGMIPGEGASHAWTEIYDSGMWAAIDPTHNRICDDTYIKISSGRDAKDCAMNQGVFTGGGKQIQEVKVIVKII